jgi:shikimate kinase
MAILKALGTVVYLAADADTLAKRLQEDSTRPLLAGATQPVDNKKDFNKAKKEKLERISQLLRERDPVYRMADITIDTSFQTPESVVNRLIAEFNRLQTSEDFDKTV